MAFEEIKKILNGCLSDHKVIMSILSAGSVLFAYWSLVNLLSSIPFAKIIFSSIWFSFFHTLPIAILLCLQFFVGNDWLVALKKDWMNLSNKTHLKIAIISIIISLAGFIMVNKKSKIDIINNNLA